MTNIHDAIAEGIAKELGATCIPMRETSRIANTTYAYPPSNHQDHYQLTFTPDALEQQQYKTQQIALCSGRIFICNSFDELHKGGIPLADPNLIETIKTRLVQTKTKSPHTHLTTQISNV